MWGGNFFINFGMLGLYSRIIRYVHGGLTDKSSWGHNKYASVAGLKGRTAALT